MNNQEDSVYGAQSFHLSETQLREMVELANASDGEAAFKLYMHFSFWALDDEKGNRWLKKAAKMKHELAIQHLENLDNELKGKGSHVESENASNPFE